MRVDWQIGGSDVSCGSLDVDGRDGGMYEFVFGSIIGSLSAFRGRDVAFLSTVDDSPEGVYKKKCMSTMNAIRDGIG